MTSHALNKILVVDDDIAILRILKAHLEAEGYEVHTAFDGQQALDVVRKEMPCYLITDWEMPGCSGLDLCRQIRQLELDHYVYIIFLTARSNEGDLAAAMHAGADNFLNKPFRRHELLARLIAGARVLALESRLSELAAHDGLSGLLLRGPFDTAMEKEWCRARRFHQPLSVVMLDIDFFKQVNDVHGHPAGDEVIRCVSQLMREHGRGGDVFSRYGGEEFCALLPNTDEVTATLWAEEVRQAIANKVMLFGGHNLQVTASLGVAEMWAEVEDKDELVAMADQCLLSAKQQGRNRVISFRHMSESGALATDEDSCSKFAGVLARDAMIPLVHCLRADWSIVRAASYFLRYRVSSAPVTDADGSLLGIVADKDVLAIAHCDDAPDRQVTDVMRGNVITYDETSPLIHILLFLTRASFRSVLVTTDGKPSGVISRASLVRWLLDQHWPAENGGSRQVGAGGSPEPTHADDSHDEGEWDLLKAATELTAEAEQLRQYLQEESRWEGPAPVVGGASRMQHLIDELLAGSARGNRTGGGLPF